MEMVMQLALQDIGQLTDLHGVGGGIAVTTGELCDRDR
jgi:hypothetical protein